MSLSSCADDFTKYVTIRRSLRSSLNTEFETRAYPVRVAICPVLFKTRLMARLKAMLLQAEIEADVNTVTDFVLKTLARDLNDMYGKCLLKFDPTLNPAEADPDGGIVTIQPYVPHGM